MKKLYALVAAIFVAVPVFAFAAPVFADSPGQLSNSPTNYKVRNVTTNGSYGQTASAACNETVRYSVILSNSDFGLLTNLTVKANMATGAINASATNVVGATTSVSGNAKVNTTGTLQYVAGSTVRIAEDAVTRTAVADGVTTANGVNVGNLNGSTAIFVQWDAKVKCDTPPAPTYACVALDVAKGSNRTVTITGFRTSAANGAQFRRANINWGDNSAVLQSANPVGATHQFAADGTYTVKATAVFVVNGQEVTADSANCAKQVTFKTEVVKITVCELATKKIIVINEKDFDASKHSKDLTKCADKPKPGEITVCELSTKKVITISEDKFDASKHSKDLTKCATPVTPEELPNTGVGSLIGVFAAVTVAGAIAHRLVWARFRGL